jgi:hypothetical protein
MGVIFNEVMNEPESMKNIKKILLTNKEQALAIQQLTVARFLPLILSLNKSIKNAIRTFKMYKTFEEEVEYIFNFKKVLKDKEKVNYDMMKGWGLDKNKKPNQREVTSQAQVNTRLENKDMEMIEEAITIKHSNDINIESFARALKQRIVAFNWKLKNKYILFGLRKGIDDIMAIINENKLILGKEQIKTKQDHNELQNLINRILARHGLSHTSISKEKIKTILIGIPYKFRVGSTLKIKEFINVIYNIEKGKHKEQVIKFEELSDLTEENFAKIMRTEVGKNINADIREIINNTPEQEEEGEEIFESFSNKENN